MGIKTCDRMYQENTNSTKISIFHIIVSLDSESMTSDAAGEMCKA